MIAYHGGFFCLHSETVGSNLTAWKGPSDCVAAASSFFFAPPLARLVLLGDVDASFLAEGEVDIVVGLVGVGGIFALGKLAVGVDGTTAVLTFEARGTSLLRPLRTISDHAFSFSTVGSGGAGAGSAISCMIGCVITTSCIIG